MDQDQGGEEEGLGEAEEKLVRICYVRKSIFDKRRETRALWVRVFECLALRSIWEGLGGMSPLRFQKATPGPAFLSPLPPPFGPCHQVLENQNQALSAMPAHLPPSFLT